MAPGRPKPRVGGKRAASHVREPAPDYRGLPSVWRAADAPGRQTPLLLDTHVWLWVIDGTPGALAPAVRRTIEQAAGDRRLFVSDFSCWEVAMLAAKGRLELAVDVNAWLDRALEAPGIQTVTLTRAVLVRSTTLPGEPHGDPADRILLSSAHAIGAALMTCDRGIIAYATRTPGVAVCDARA